MKDVAQIAVFSMVPHLQSGEEARPRLCMNEWKCSKSRSPRILQYASKPVFLKVNHLLPEKEFQISRGEYHEGRNREGI